MMKNIAAFFFLLALWPANHCAAQNTHLIKSKFDSYLQDNFQEKLYMHTDRSSYLAGEMIWFKIYNVEAYTNRLVGVSKVAYIELLDHANNPLLQSKIELKDCQGHGTLRIPVSLSSGLYTIRCYTSWMKNFEPDFFFHKDIVIYNTLKEEPLFKEEPQKAASYNIQFFPEGGNLVEGLVSKVAFKAVDEQGEVFDFYAAVLNTRNDTVLKFQPSCFGLGSFYFKPERQETYKAWIKPARGPDFYVPLPRVFEKGAVMLLKENGSDLSLSISSNLNTSEKFAVFVHSGQRTIFIDSLNVNPKKEIHIPLDTLGDGISHFTLFGDGGEALCERLYFKRPVNLLKVEAATDKHVYSPREKVRLVIDQTFKGLPAKGDFSVSVYRIDSVNVAGDDIGVNLWLTSELKGKIGNAGWYFSSAPAAAMDLLMLTHGWRRFKWEDVLSEKKVQVTYPPEVYCHAISGRTVISSSDTASVDRISFLSIPGRNGKLYTASYDKNGTINFYTSNFYGGSEIILQSDSRTDSLASITINSPFSSRFAVRTRQKFNFSPQPEDLLKRSVALQISNVYHQKKFSKEIALSSDSSMFYRQPDKVYKLDDYVRFTTMEEVLREYVSEITVSVRRNVYQLRVLDLEAGKFHEAAPFILIDGVPVFDEGSSVIRMDPLKIQRLEIISSDYMYGRNIFPGILSVHTYKGSLAGFQLPRKALVLDYEGLQQKREFYSPMYEGDSAVYSRIPDYRTTLYWNPTNHVGEKGRTELSFFTSDMDGKYVVDIQSLSFDGKPGSARTTIAVGKRSISETK